VPALDDLAAITGRPTAGFLCSGPGITIPNRERAQKRPESSLVETPASQRVQVLDARLAGRRKSGERSVFNLLDQRSLRHYGAVGRMVRILLGLVARLFVTCVGEAVSWLTNK
jgi:hypothetical protein